VRYDFLKSFPSPEAQFVYKRSAMSSSSPDDSTIIGEGA
jgi:hypothetical protein